MPNNSLAPVALFVFNRLEHARHTIESLSLNSLADKTDVYIFSDGPKDCDKSRDQVANIRHYLKKIDAFKSLTIIEREANYGLSKSIISGVNQILKLHESVIVMEDDLVTSPHFLSYMNEALIKFSNDEVVVSVHAYLPPLNVDIPFPFFLRGADCWGWATWRRGWKFFNPDGKHLLRQITEKKLTNEFDFGGSYPYTKMLEQQIFGVNDSWAIRWYASAFLANKLTLHPNISLVRNIGLDSSGTHCLGTDDYDVSVSNDPIDLSHCALEESAFARNAFRNYFLSLKNSNLNKIKLKILGVLRRVGIYV